ncbi:hypothetical protein TrVFT333_002124 [Trichoderma virens FT-333]|nr:hypothetical protein TrVFT333_002124 [Trichoderma virens FT-333]
MPKARKRGRGSGAKTRPEGFVPPPTRLPRLHPAPPPAPVRPPTPVPPPPRTPPNQMIPPYQPSPTPLRCPALSPPSTPPVVGMDVLQACLLPLLLVYSLLLQVLDHRAVTSGLALRSSPLICRLFLRFLLLSPQ